VITYDPKKDKANKRKHGISLKRGRISILKGPCTPLTIVKITARFDSVRSAFWDARLYTLVFVDEDESDNLRASSLRKATKHEAKEFKASR
jgi:uncharacterized DUF497 family protein